MGLAISDARLWVLPAKAQSVLAALRAQQAVVQRTRLQRPQRLQLAAAATLEVLASAVRQSPAPMGEPLGGPDDLPSGQPLASRQSPRDCSVWPRSSWAPRVRRVARCPANDSEVQSAHRYWCHLVVVVVVTSQTRHAVLLETRVACETNRGLPVVEAGQSATLCSMTPFRNEAVVTTCAKWAERAWRRRC